MAFKNLILTALIPVFSIAPAAAQPPDVSRLYEKLHNAREDTDRVNSYYTLSHYYWSSNADSALLLGKEGLHLATNIHFEKGMALCYLTMGVAYEMQGLYPEALNSHLQGLRLSEKLGLDGLSGNFYGDIAIVYSDMGDYLHAIGYERRSLESARKYHARDGIAAAYCNLAEYYADDKLYDSAIRYNEHALAIAEAIHDTVALGASLQGLGQDYTGLSQPQKALPPLQRSLEIAQISQDAAGAAIDRNSLAEAYLRLGKYRKSIDESTQALKSAEAIHSSDIEKASCDLLYKDYQALKDLKDALYYRNREIALHDSLYNLAKEKQVKKLQDDYELEQKQHQIDLLSKDREIQSHEIAKNRIRQYLIFGGALLLALWVFFLVNSNRQIQKLNRLLQARNNEVLHKNKQLEELNAIKNKLLSIIGHDLRSPVSTLKGFVDLLKASAITPEQISYFSGKMSESLEGTYYLLENLLNWAKSQMEGMQPDARQFDLGTVIRRNMELAKHRAGAKNITLQSQGIENPPPVYADEVMIDMVIRNLVDNALKFSRGGDTVTITAGNKGRDTLITVGDTGVGIPPEAQTKIFSTTLTHTTMGTSREKGSGLGLSLCKELVEKNGGTIRFASEPGKGTTFIITLPAAPPA